MTTEAAETTNESERATPQSPSIRLLRSRDFSLLWWGQVTSQFGEALNKVALLWFVYELTGSALKMTVIGLLQTVPPLVFGPLLGVCLDRWRKRSTMIVVDFTRMGLVAAIPFLYSHGWLSLNGLYGLVFLISLVSTIFGPALISSIPLLVKPSDLLPANALIQATNNIGLVLGPAISGLGIALIGAQNVLYVNAVTFFISGVCLLAMRMHEQPHAAAPLQGAQFVDDLLAGFRFVFVQHRTLTMLVVISALYHLGVSAFIFLLPVYTKEHLQVGPMQLGWLWSALGAGMLLTSIGLTFLPSKGIGSRLNTIGRAMVIGGVAMWSLTLMETTFVAISLILIIGGSTAVFNPIASALLQELTPAPLIGRVLTTFSTGAMASAMAGMASFGWVAEAAGPAMSLTILGVLLIVAAGLILSYSHLKLAPREAVPVPA